MKIRFEKRLEVPRLLVILLPLVAFFRIAKRDRLRAEHHSALVAAGELAMRVAGQRRRG